MGNDWGEKQKQDRYDFCNDTIYSLFWETLHLLECRLTEKCMARFEAFKKEEHNLINCRASDFTKEELEFIRAGLNEVEFQYSHTELSEMLYDYVDPVLKERWDQLLDQGKVKDTYEELRKAKKESE